MRVVAVAALVGLAASTACKSRAEPHDFDGQIRKRVAELGLPPSKVACATDRPLAIGSTFTCTVTIDGTAYDLDATIEDAAGSGDLADVTLSTHWQRGDAVVASRLAPRLSAAMTHTLSTPVSVTCGEDALAFVAADRTVRCALVAGTSHAAMIVTFDDKLVPTSWKLDPPMLSRTKLEADLAPLVQAKVGSSDAWVHCGREPLLARPADGKLPCILSLAGHDANVAVTVSPTLAVTRWEILGEVAAP